MEEVKKVKCSNCGFSNVLGAKKCIKCNAKLKAVTKSCPRCAKKNDINNNKCVSCGYNFNKKRRSVWFNLIISMLLVIVLCSLLALKKMDTLNGITNILKVLAILFIVYLVYSTLTYGSKEIANYDKEKELVKENKNISKMKKYSNVAIVIGTIIILGIAIYFCIFK